MNDKFEAEDGENDAESKVIVFPQSRTQTSGSKDKFKELGLSELSRRIGDDPPGLTGHWCRFCEGIWYGYALECECPQCGNRSG